jgi:hypothetical protein
MARRVGDLWPFASGTSSLGVDQLDGPQAGFTNEIRPFNHAHMNSGVWHDPQSGISGVFRFRQAEIADAGFQLPRGRYPAFEISFDGGKTFPLEFAGTMENSDPGSLYPNGVAFIQSGNDSTLGVRGSGLIFISEGSTRYFALNAETGGVGSIQYFADSTITFSAGAAMQFTGADDITIQTNGVDGDITLLSSPGTPGQELGGQIALQAFAGSGQLEYRLGGIGGHEAWHWKPSYESGGGPNADGFHPIPSSGQILRMINDEIASIDVGITELTDINASIADDSSIELQGNGTVEVVVQDAATVSFDASFAGVNGIEITNPAVGFSVFNGIALSGLFSINNETGPDITIAGVNGIDVTVPSSNTILIDGIAASGKTDAIQVTYDSGTPQDINAAATDNLVLWNVNDLIEGDGLSHSTSTNTSRITANTSGVFVAHATLAWNTAGVRYNGIARFRLNGTTNINGRSKCGYTRNTGGHNEASLHLEALVRMVSGDYLEVLVDRESLTSSAVNLSNNQSLFAVYRLEGVGGGANDTLQSAYENGTDIYLTRAAGRDDLDIISVDGATRFSTNGTHSEVGLSGLLSAPGLANSEVGDMNFFVHSLEPRSGGSFPGTLAESQARALGPGSLAFDTGSGVANVRIGSGISQFFNTSNQTLSTSPTAITFTNAGNTVPDTHFVRAAGNSGVKVMLPGTYRVQYTASFQKTAGSTPQTVGCELTLARDDGPGPLGLIPGGVSSAFLFDSSDNDTNTANGLAMVDLYPGDCVVLEATLTASPGGNTVRAQNREANLIIEYIGPRRMKQTLLPT